MAVQTGTNALTELRRLMEEGHDDRPFGLEGLPESVRTREPKGWLWRSGQHRPGLRDPAAYEQLSEGRPGLADIIHLPPAEALQLDPARSAGRAGYDANQQQYLRSSIDVTMKGGIASGVIYPLALCELARDFRLRNVGGASAGAIAAAFGAAAERGRATAAGPVGATPPADGHCRPGFVGLADVIAGLTQLDRPNGHHLNATTKEDGEEFRTAQLFKPNRVSLRLFRVVAALLRRRFWALPVLAATSFGARMRIASLSFVLLLPALVCLAAWISEGPPPVPLWSVYLQEAGWLLATLVAVCGLVIVVGLGLGRLAARRRRHQQAPEPLRPPLPARPAAAGPPLLGYLLVTAVGVGAAALLMRSGSGWSWLGLERSVLGWLIGVLVVVALMVASILALIGAAKPNRFGLVDGRTVDAETDRANGWFSRLMGMPRVTESRNITDWLDDCLRELAGVSGVLRFGHLWSAAYDAEHTAKAKFRTVEAAADDPDYRLVNLELMATELVHRVPYKFPLDPDEELYFRHSDLEPIFPEAVLTALCQAGPDPRPRWDVETGEPIRDLYRLPQPWDLPVVVAVRISMAFPGLFTAVRLYRPAAEAELPLVRDEFGARIVDVATDNVLTYPRSAPDGNGVWMQELWLSDGGITSNFPIHFFDAVLPRWPTVGINLGRHPRGFGHQDVYLPTDQQATKGVPTEIGGSMLTFVRAVLDTARNWRDTAQTFMPASRGRIAWVRQSRDEGGANLFMPRDRVAALALRGAVAGARLRRRFSAPGQWERHQWLRLRVGTENLARLHSRIERALHESRYDELASGPAAACSALHRTFVGLADAADPTPPGPDAFGVPSVAGEPDDETPFTWYVPEDPAFWSAAQAMYAGYGAMGPTSEALLRDIPKPAAALRQVPAV